MAQTSEVASLQSNLHQVTAGSHNPLVDVRLTTTISCDSRMQRRRNRVGKATALTLGPLKRLKLTSESSACGRPTQR
jgi:hypothetical protein